ncbi:MAG: hypothetical protein IKY23_09745 [Lachnospiraceae bacterium]|nr:hypothetical protein [Lachnospiraceae bacterium]
MSKKKKVLLLLIGLIFTIAVILMVIFHMHPHTYEKKVLCVENCIDEGHIHYECWCGDAYDEYPEVLGHDYVSEITAQATCIKNGITTFTCSRCNATYTDDISAFGHDITEEVKKAECEVAGYERKSCKNCNLVEESEIPALEHDYQMSQETDIEKIFVCQNCADSYTEEKPKLVEKVPTIRPEDIDPSIGKTDGTAYTEEQRMADLQILLDAGASIGYLEPAPTPPPGVDINNLSDNQAWTGLKLITVDFDSMMSRDCEAWTDDEHTWCRYHYQRTDLPVIKKLHAHNKIKYAGITLH